MNYLSRVLILFSFSIYLAFGMYFDGFRKISPEARDVISNECWYLNYERGSFKINFNLIENKKYLLSYVQIKSNVIASYINYYRFDLNAFIERCFAKSELGGMKNGVNCILKFDDCNIIYTKDKRDFIENKDDGGMYSRDEVDLFDCTIYVIHKSILGTTNHIVLFQVNGIGDINVYLLKEGCNVYASFLSDDALCVKTCNFSDVIKQNNWLMKELEKLEVADSKKLVSTSATVDPTMITKIPTPLKNKDVDVFNEGPVTYTPGKKNNDSQGSSSDSDNKGNDSPKKCCRCC